MNSKINAYSMFFVMSLLVQTAHAEDLKLGLFVEPALTYDIGTTAVDFPAPLTNSSGTSTGYGLAAKFGAHVSEVLFLAMDARYSMPQFNDSSVNYNAASVATNWGPVLGVQMQEVGMRVWTTLILGGEYNPKNDGNLNVLFKDATGYRIGTGFHIGAFSLNIEYQDLKYGSSVLEQLGPFTSDSAFQNVNLNSSTWIASLSFPIEL